MGQKTTIFDFMLFKDILGLAHIKNHLALSADAGRIPHAQLFVGPEGSGTLPMALAYAQYIVCGNKNGENLEGAVNCNLKFDSFSHPDVHFAFPVANSDKVKSHAVSNHFIQEWRQFVSEQPYGNLFDWYRLIDIEKKQGQIGVDEALDVVKKLSLKSYEGGYKVMLIWMAERMNNAAANKLLKLIEEPPEKTVFLLLCEDEEQIIQTIRSRCQVLHFPPLSEDAITKALIEKGANKQEAIRIAHEANGNFNKAIDLLNEDSEDLVFEKWFVQWVRTAFKAKGNNCITVMRQAMLINYGAEELAYMKIHDTGFQLKKFAPFVHENNIIIITEELEKAIYHIERNGNAKIVFTDLSIKLTRLLHKKPNQLKT